MSSLLTVPNDDSGILSAIPIAQLIPDNDTHVCVGQGSASRLTAWRNTCCESALSVVSDDDVRQHHHFGPHEEDDEQRDHSKHQAH